MRTEKTTCRNGITLLFLAAAMAGAPSSVTGQSHAPDSESLSAVVDAGAVEQGRGDALRALKGPTVGTLTLLPATPTASDRIALPESVTRALPQERKRKGVPFMVAGGILFITGAIIGNDAGTILMIGGAGIGAYGAFVHFGG